ncbi:MAG: hypothetical protein QXX87_06315, partial [Candidatus Jordarchaeales archaeon]
MSLKWRIVKLTVSTSFTVTTPFVEVVASSGAAVKPPFCTDNGASITATRSSERAKESSLPLTHFSLSLL